MDELESRISDGLGRRAADVAPYDDNLRTITRRGRNRRWAATGVRAVGALALVAGGIALYRAADPEPRDSLAAGDDGGSGVVIESPQPTPAPTPLPEPDEQPPEPAATPEPETVVRDVFAVSATGWGAGLVGSSGDYFSALACCEDTELDWATQEPESPSLGATRVRDDLGGGLVASTVDSLWWQPADAIAAGATPILLDTSAGEAPGRLDLWDVTVVEDTMRVLYSTQTISEDRTSGEAELRSIEIVGTDPGPPQVLDRVAWDDAAAGHTWTGAGWIAEGGRMELRAAAGGGCEWVVYAETDGSYQSPFAAPGENGECPQDSIGAAAVNTDGQLAVIERFLSQPPVTAELALYDRAGNELSRQPLPETADGVPRWTEIDMVGPDVLVSRGPVGTDPMLDEVLRIDIEGNGVPRPLPFVGNPSFARSDIATSDLPVLSSDDARWFGADASPGGDGDDDTPDEPAPEPTPDAQPEDPQSDLVPDSRVPPESRIPLGRGVDVKDVGALAGDTACVGSLCVGMPLDEAVAAAEGLFGPAVTSDDDLADTDALFLTEGRKIRILAEDGVVASIEVTVTGGDQPPATDVFGTSLAEDPLTVADVLSTLGAPAEITNDGGDPRIVWLFYDTTAGLVGYGVVEADAADGVLLDVGDTTLPVTYDDLAIGAYWARPRG